MKTQPISNENSYIYAISSSNCVLDDTHMRACVWNHPFTRTFKYLEPPHPQQDSGGHARGGNVFFFFSLGWIFLPKETKIENWAILETNTHTHTRNSWHKSGGSRKLPAFGGSKMVPPRVLPGSGLKCFHRKVFTAEHSFLEICVWWVLALVSSGRER